MVWVCELISNTSWTELSSTAVSPGHRYAIRRLLYQTVPFVSLRLLLTLDRTMAWNAQDLAFIWLLNPWLPVSCVCCGVLRCPQVWVRTLSGHSLRSERFTYVATTCDAPPWRSSSSTRPTTSSTSRRRWGHMSFSSVCLSVCKSVCLLKTNNLWLKGSEFPRKTDREKWDGIKIKKRKKQDLPLSYLFHTSFR